MKRKLWLSLTLASSISFCSNPSYALEPVSTVASIVGGSIFCKMIQCEKVTTNIVQYRDERKINKRLQEMRDNFKWEDSYCRSSPALEQGQKICWKNGVWKVIK